MRRIRKEPPEKIPGTPIGNLCGNPVSRRGKRAKIAGGKTAAPFQRTRGNPVFIKADVRGGFGKKPAERRSGMQKRGNFPERITVMLGQDGGMIIKSAGGQSGEQKRQNAVPGGEKTRQSPPGLRRQTDFQKKQKRQQIRGKKNAEQQTQTQSDHPVERERGKRHRQNRIQPQEKEKRFPRRKNCVHSYSGCPSVRHEERFLPFQKFRNNINPHLRQCKRKGCGNRHRKRNRGFFIRMS